LIHVVDLGVARAERIIDDYVADKVDRAETIARLMRAFGLEELDAEMTVNEVDEEGD
jgi:hypothetical protein